MFFGSECCPFCKLQKGQLVIIGTDEIPEKYHTEGISAEIPNFYFCRILLKVKIMKQLELFKSSRFLRNASEATEGGQSLKEILSSFFIYTTTRARMRM